MSVFHSDILIIGGGAAGLMAGIAAAETCGGAAGVGASGSGLDAVRECAAGAAVPTASPIRVMILEKMPRPGRKIVITGKGRCNMTNMKDWEDFSQHIHPAPNFMKNAFYGFTPQNLTAFFESHGLETVTERGDRVFPASYKSMDVVDTLVSAAEGLGVQLRTGTEVVEINPLGNVEAESDGDEPQTSGLGRPEALFQIRTSDGDIYLAKRVIVTTGGLSYPATGSTGDGLNWAKGLGLSIVPCFPSLTAIVPKGYKIVTNSEKGHISRTAPLSEIGKVLNGNQLKNVLLKIFIDGQEMAEEFGDLDFSDGGIEGPIGFKVSRQCVKALRNGSRVRAVLDLKPAVAVEKLQGRISALREEMAGRGSWRGGGQTIGRSGAGFGHRGAGFGRRGADRKPGRPENDVAGLLRGLLPTDLIQGFLKSARPDSPAKLAKALKNWEFEIAGYVGYERCVITAGGISTKELSPKTLECKNIHGLYFAGEIVDIDADTGGYNLQCAFSTGHLAGQSAAKSL